MALKRFNKARKSGKVPATIQRPHLKGLYYYGDIERAKARCKNPWTDDQKAEVKEEKRKNPHEYDATQQHTSKGIKNE